MIIPNITVMDDRLLRCRFANQYLGDSRTIRIGNIISFISLVDLFDDTQSRIKPLNEPVRNARMTQSEEAINFCLELPELSNYAGVCFQRLFVTNVANILAVKYFKADMEIVNNDIIIKKEHKNGGINQVDGIVSINRISNVNGAILIYLGLHNKAGNMSPPRAFSLNLDRDICNKLMDSVNESFYNLANSIFLKTAKM